MQLPNTLKEYFSAAIGCGLADNITGTFGKNTAADLAIYMYAADNKKIDPNNSGGFEQNAINLSNAALSAAGQDIASKVSSITSPRDRLAFIAQVEKTIGGDKGKQAGAALEDYYTASDNLQNTTDKSPANLTALFNQSRAASSAFMQELKSSLDTAHNTGGKYVMGIMGNSTDSFAVENGPTAKANMEINAYAAARAAQAGGRSEAFNDLEIAARKKIAYDHGAFMTQMLNPANQSKLQAALNVVQNSGAEASQDEKSAAAIILQEQSGNNRAAFNTAVSTLAHAQYMQLTGGLNYDVPPGHGNPDEAAALSTMGFGAVAAPSMQPAQGQGGMAPTQPVPAPAKEPAQSQATPMAPAQPAPQLHLFNFGSTPAPSAGVQQESFSPAANAVKATRIDMNGVTGGETVQQAPKPASIPAPQRGASQGIWI